MEHTLTFSAAIVAAVLTGGIPFGYIAGKALKGIDVREHGSGNLGATNVARVLGLPVGIGVLLLDAAKGFVPPFFFPMLAEQLGGVGEATPWLAPVLALCAIAGHNWPPYLRFRGGKGVATSLGALLAIDPLCVCVGLAFFIIVAIATRWVSLGSIVAGLAAMAFAWLTSNTAHDLQADLFITVLAVLIVVRHRANIKRILSGTEPRFGLSKKEQPSQQQATDGSKGGN